MLHEQNGFDRRFSMSIQKSIEEVQVELVRVDFRSVAFPPVRLVSAMMKTDAPELARVGENKRAFALIQNEVVVFRRTIVWTFDPDFPGHAKMNTEPVVPGKFEEHSFPARVRAQKSLTD